MLIGNIEHIKLFLNKVNDKLKFGFRNSNQVDLNYTIDESH